MHVDTSRQPDGELCYCAVSTHKHRHIGFVMDERAYRAWNGMTADEARRCLLEEIFGE